MRILNTAQMREADRRTIEELGLPSIVLMENAGRQVVAALESLYADLLERRIAVVCGRGNNGGDGFVVARTLHQRGADVSVFLIGQVADVRGDARVNLEILGRLGVAVIEVADEQTWELHASAVARSQLIVDAIVGTGARGPLTGMLEAVVADLNAAGVPIVSVDLPSGLSADTAEVAGEAVAAAVTVTLGAPKVPLVLPPAEARAGDVIVADIGIPPSIIEDLPGPHLVLLTRDRIRRLLVPRDADSHKGDYGRVAIVAGSRGKTGAAVLAAEGALRSGAGLVTVLTPRSCQPIVAAHGVEYMTEGLEETAAGTVSEAAVEAVLEFGADVVAVGPGLGRGEHVSRFVRGLVARSAVPLVLDADALNAFAGDPTALVGREGLDVVITPHPGEMARLVGATVEDVQANRVGIAVDFATTHRVYVVLKGYRTIVATPHGRAYVNPTGCAGMATGGTGDVLTGMVAAWLAQLLDAEQAVQLAAYLHGAAGELAEADEGEVAMTAQDVAGHIGDAVLEVSARRRVVAKPE